MTAGVIDTRNFAKSYEETQRRLRLLEQQISNPDIQVGQTGGGDGIFDSVVINNPGAGPDLVIDFVTGTPTGLGAITSTYLHEVYIDAEWTAPASGEVSEYEIELARRTSPGVYDQARVYRTASTTVRLIVPLGGVIYGIRVASVNRLGIRSSFTSRIDVTTAVDSTIPNTITGLVVTAAINSLVVTFDRLSDDDMQNGDGLYRVQLSSNDFTDILKDKYTSSNVESFDGLTQGTNYKVRVAGIDPSGNQGPYTTSGNTQVGYVTEAHIVANSISGDRITAATITGAKIVAGSVDGDRITTNTLDANRIKTSTLTAADINISGGSLTAGTPVTGDGALLNSQGFKLYKDGQITVNLDALTGDASFTGDLVGSNIYGGYIESPEIVGSVNTGEDIVPNGKFDTDVTGWSMYAIGTHLGTNSLFEHAVSPDEVVSGTSSCLRVVWDGSGNWRPNVTTVNIAIEPSVKYTVMASVRSVSVTSNYFLSVTQFQADGTSFATPHIGEYFINDWPIPLSGTINSQEMSFISYPDAAFIRIALVMFADIASPSGKQILIDDVRLVKDKGISNIQYQSGSFGEDGIVVNSTTQLPNYMIDRITFARPSELSDIEDYKDGFIKYFVNGGTAYVDRDRRMEITTGGYAGFGGQINEAEITLQSGMVTEDLIGSEIVIRAQRIQLDRAYSGAGVAASILINESGNISMSGGALTFNGGTVAVNNVAKGRIFDSYTAGETFWPGSLFPANVGNDQHFSFQSSSINFGATSRKYRFSMFLRATSPKTTTSLVVFHLYKDNVLWTEFGYHTAHAAYEHVHVSWIASLSGSHTVQVRFNITGGTGMNLWRDFNSYFMIEDIGPG